jgi:linoleoyl-CoA desaturase
MWDIYGKKYDLSNFAKYHPGGSEIIEKMRNIGDCTALFETYHAFSDITAIRESLKKYEIADCSNSVITTNPTDQPDFTTYHKLIDEIKSVFPDRASVKAPLSWYLWNTTALSIMVFIYYQLMIIQNIYIKCGLAILCGIIESSSILYNMLHDGSHYAISLHPTANNYISRISSSWFLWNHLLWLYHHVYYHHSFTGGKNDPDLHLYNTNTSVKNSDNMTIIAMDLWYSIFPGQYIGQALLYLRNSFKHTILLSDLNIPNITYYDEVSVSIMLVKLYCLWSMGVIPSILIITMENTFYYINVMGDHDLFETYENHYDGNDWAKRQICNSGNFMNEYWLWTMLFSGINHQIEHHLFPNMSGHQYAKIAPIVKQFCKDNNIPYVHKPTLLDAYKSFTKRILINK